MPKIRVLVVDDSVVIRRLVTDVLNADPAIEVVAIAANGRIALAKVQQVQPDVITLDVEMPEMGGLETLAEIRKTHPRLPVIMFSTLTALGASATLDALALGANDYVTKPANVGSVGEAQSRLASELIPKIKQFCRSIVPVPATSSAPIPGRIPALSRPPPPTTIQQRVEIVVIGVSTGGPDALSKLMPALPADLAVPVLIVQHMPPVFTKSFADRLNATSPLRVSEATPGDRLAPGSAWIAPGDFHMTVGKHEGHFVLGTNQGPRENSCRPAADVLFRSAIETYGSHVLGVVLTGMGQDGFRGSEAIRAAGGQVLAQDEATSIVWGMPGFIARAGLANAILPLNQIAGEIVRRVHFGRPFSASSPL
jgi:two-component system chemotaxis response regulator CheB